MYAARLARALRERMDVRLFGMGGPQMRAAGVEVVTDYSRVSVVGITEILSHLPSLVRAMRGLVAEARRRRPAFAILTDFPGFHLRLARKLRPAGTRNIYFICPQFWAWRPWRVRLVRRRFAKALCIFPFEESFYADAGVPVEFIGHPLVGAVAASLSREQFCQQHELDASRPLVTILPGSRRGELARHVPVLREACMTIAAAQPGVQFVWAAAPGTSNTIRELLGTGQPNVPLGKIIEGQTYDALAAANVSVVASGTATVEAALLDAPMVVVYRVSSLTAFLAKPLVRTRFFGMVNLVAGREVAPERIQSQFTAGNVAGDILKLLREPSATAKQRAGLAEVRERLGPPGAIERAADIIVAMLQDQK